MKKGSGSDPFADHDQEQDQGQDEGGDKSKGEETESEEQSTADAESETNASTTERVDGTEDEGATASTGANAELEATFDETATSGDNADAASDDEPSAPAETEQRSPPPERSGSPIVDDPPQAGADDGGVPWVYVRDNVKQDRDMVQFYLRDYLVDAEDEFVDAVSDELGTDVSKTDVREAAYEAAMHNVDDVVERLEAWGFESAE